MKRCAFRFCTVLSGIQHDWHEALVFTQAGARVGALDDGVFAGVVED